MEKVLIFAGTKEGRILAEHMCRFQNEVHISVATEYGEELLPQKQELIIHRGRLNEAQMEELLKAEEWKAVIDATHPYAIEVSENLKQACRKTDRSYLRLIREEKEETARKDVLYVKSKEEAAAYLNRSEGNILLTTGSKELSEYVSLISDISRIYARILPDGETVNKCREMGLLGNQIICMQGPFSAELNEAMLKQLQAKFLVTKDTGETGGLPQKLEGAKRAGATTVIIQRPKEEQGYSMEQLLEYLGIPLMETEQKTVTLQHQTVTLLGIGMGSLEGMTLEAYQACQKADVILGAERMVKALERFGKPEAPIYQPLEVVGFLQQHPEYQKVVVAFSGDVGFYSGAGKLLEVLKEKDYEAELICGISSVVYAASRLKMPWQDMKLVSIHGRVQNVIGALRTHEKVFSLVEGKEGVRKLARELLDYGMEFVCMHVGCQLGYSDENVVSGMPEDFLDYNKKGLSVVVLENAKAKRTVITHGLPDENFLRGEAPMTKEEIRSISISKLALTKEAVVYDIGAGTGSIGVECALQIPEGRVYAIEKKKEALKLLEENKKKLRTCNLEIIAGTAPEACNELPAPTHAFIGGSSGNMETIILQLLEKNPKVRIVINAIALETVAEVNKIMQKHKFEIEDVVQVSVGKARTLGQYHMMMGQNPVYIFTLQREAIL